MTGPAKMRVLGRSHHSGGAHPDDVSVAASLINSAKAPVLLLGMFASAPDAAAELRRLLAVHAMPAVTTFQGIGVVPRELCDLFGGRVGLIRNTTTDRLLDEADVVVAVGYVSGVRAGRAGAGLGVGYWPRSAAGGVGGLAAAVRALSGYSWWPLISSVPASSPHACKRTPMPATQPPRPRTPWNTTATCGTQTAAAAPSSTSTRVSARARLGTGLGACCFNTPLWLPFQGTTCAEAACRHRVSPRHVSPRSLSHSTAIACAALPRPPCVPPARLPCYNAPIPPPPHPGPDPAEPIKS